MANLEDLYNFRSNARKKGLLLRHGQEKGVTCEGETTAI